MKIALDAGHGPDTPGKRTPDGMKEFEFNREVAVHLKSLLAADVFFMHEDSRDVPLSERVRRANSGKADLYVSIHANAYGSGWSKPSGIETYVHTSKPKRALFVARAVQRELVQATGRRSRGVKTADFFVLRKTAMPAILIEAGFMTNREEAALLKSSAYRLACAQAIARGIHAF